MAKRNGDATSTIQTRKDPKDGFTRTAIVVEGNDTGSIDLVDRHGNRLCQINVSYLPSSDGEETLIVDVIDVDKRFTTRRALAFSPADRRILDVPQGGNLVSVDFRRPVKS